MSHMRKFKKGRAISVYGPNVVAKNINLIGPYFDAATFANALYKHFPKLSRHMIDRGR